MDGTIDGREGNAIREDVRTRCGKTLTRPMYEAVEELRP